MTGATYSPFDAVSGLLLSQDELKDTDGAPIHVGSSGLSKSSFPNNDNERKTTAIRHLDITPFPLFTSSQASNVTSLNLATLWPWSKKLLVFFPP
jgi:hypothetical protein